VCPRSGLRGESLKNWVFGLTTERGVKKLMGDHSKSCEITKRMLWGAQEKVYGTSRSVSSSLKKAGTFPGNAIEGVRGRTQRRPLGS